MLKQQFPTHFFHAYGSGFGATITKPFHLTVESQAATSITSIGGHAFARQEKFNHKELLRFESATTQIAAVEEEDSYDTVVTCCLEHVNLFNQFRAEAIVAHLSIKTMKDPAKPMSFRTVGCHFKNLVVGGVALHPELEDEDGDEYGTGKINHPVYDLKTGDRINGRASARGNLTTLVSAIGGAGKKLQVKGNAIFVPDYGVVYLAEYLVTPYARHLNMFRIEFGCSVGGRAGTGIGANGISCPPPP